MIYRDINDWEDYHQFIQLIKLPFNMSTKLAVWKADKLRRALRRRMFRFWWRSREIYARNLTVDNNILVNILYPLDDRLKKIPVYHRYVLMLMALNDRAVAASILKTNKDYLNDWTQDHGYTVKQHNRVYVTSESLTDRAGEL